MPTRITFNQIYRDGSILNQQLLQIPAYHCRTLSCYSAESSSPSPAAFCGCSRKEQTGKTCSAGANVSLDPLQGQETLACQHGQSWAKCYFPLRGHAHENGQHGGFPRVPKRDLLWVMIRGPFAADTGAYTCIMPVSAAN